MRDLLWALPRRLIPRHLHRTSFPGTMIRRRCGGQVLSGPFRGLRYAESSHASAYFPKLLGIYEKELHAVIADLIVQRFDRIVDVGAAEGYYACGFARACPQSRVIAFEQVESARSAMAAMAEHNGLGARLEIRGHCTPEDLQAALAETTSGLVVMDVEGAEKELLDPEAVPALRSQPVLVELHDFRDAEISGLIRRRFEATHHLEQLWSRPRSLRDLPFRLPLGHRLYAGSGFMSCVREGRPEGMSWYLMTPM